jgi:hypothetical protein
MRLGDTVIHEGREYVLRGVDPMSVPNRRAELEDPRTGRTVVVPYEELEPVDPGPTGFDPAA